MVLEPLTPERRTLHAPPRRRSTTRATPTPNQAPPATAGQGNRQEPNPGRLSAEDGLHALASRESEPSRTVDHVLAVLTKSDSFLPAVFESTVAYVDEEMSYDVNMDALRVVLATRYAVRSPFAKPGSGLDSAEWLQHRRVLFENFCEPFVRAQTDKDFDWFVLIDESLSDSERKFIKRASGAEVISCKSQTHGMQIIARGIRNTCSHVLSIRLDSDDSIAPGFVSGYRKIAESSLMLADDFSRGFQVCYVDGVENEVNHDRWYDRYYVNNPFVGLVEPLDSPRGPGLVYQHAHYDLCRHFDAIDVHTREPMWCIRVHGNNVANQVKGVVRAEAPAAFV